LKPVTAKLPALVYGCNRPQPAIASCWWYGILTQGHLDNQSLEGLNVALACYSPGTMIEGNWQAPCISMSGPMTVNLMRLCNYLAAMMLPSAIPMILALARICRQQNKAVHRLTGLFTSAYLGMWLLFSSVLTLLQWQMHGLAWLSPMMANQNPLLAAGILFLAGVYQFMPLKNACLTHCKTPMGFLLNEWQNGGKGAFKMGLKHGANCLGCCWAQMLIMFAVGVMKPTGNGFDNPVGYSGEIHAS
jgi:predicted metal-binding membrane protein